MTFRSIKFPTDMLIDGARVRGTRPFGVRNPATEEILLEVGGASIEQVDSAIAAARRAFDSGPWPSMPAAERVRICKAMLASLEARIDEVTDIVAAETGTPVKAPITQMAQVRGPIIETPRLLDLFLTLPQEEDFPTPLADRILPWGPLAQSVKSWGPIGVVTAISAYNFPLFLNLWKIVPALATGNTVILRPSPQTPLSALLLVEAAEAAGFPAGVLNIIVEGGAEGSILLTSDPRVDKISFTGSSDVGAQVMKQAASTVKRVALELGGKSAQIFLPDRLEPVVAAASLVCTAHAGQGCVLGTRLFVPKAEKARLADQVASAFAAIRVGDPFDPETQMGPVMSAAQRERCEKYVRLAVEGGGKVVVGGGRPPGLPRGFYFQPTLLDLPDNKNPAAQDEIFGPVVCMIGYDSIDHAVEMANDSPFGLSGYVYGKDVRAALAVAQRMQTATVNINAGVVNAYVPIGGWKRSGFGHERGAEGLRAFQQFKILNLAA